MEQTEAAPTPAPAPTPASAFVFKSVALVEDGISVHPFRSAEEVVDCARKCKAMILRDLIATFVAENLDGNFMWLKLIAHDYMHTAIRQHLNDVGINITCTEIDDCVRDVMWGCKIVTTLYNNNSADVKPSADDIKEAGYGFLLDKLCDDDEEEEEEAEEAKEDGSPQQDGRCDEQRGEQEEGEGEEQESDAHEPRSPSDCFVCFNPVTSDEQYKWCSNCGLNNPIHVRCLSNALLASHGRCPTCRSYIHMLGFSSAMAGLERSEESDDDADSNANAGSNADAAAATNLYQHADTIIAALRALTFVTNAVNGVDGIDTDDEGDEGGEGEGGEDADEGRERTRTER